MPNFPASLDSIANPGAGTYTDDAGFELDVVISLLNDIAEAIEAKVGIGGANQSPVANRILGADGTGTSSWRQIATGDLVANAITQFQTATATALQTTTSTSIVDVTGGSITMTTLGGIVLVGCAGAISNNTATQFTAISLYEDGSTLGEHGLGTSPTGGAFVPFGHTLVRQPSAGSHTWKLRWRVGGNTGTLNTGVIWAVEFKK